MHIERTGEITTATLLISILSGFVLAYQYEVASPFISTTAIETIIPFGAFWRSMHFWSSQAFFILLLLHVWQCTDSMQRFCRTLSGRVHWTIASLTVPLALYALFSGYVLRFDGTGQAAGSIAEHLFIDVPLAGLTMNRFFMAVSSEGLNRVYTVHILFSALCWGIGTWYHTRRVVMGRNIFFYSLLIAFLAGAALDAPIDLPAQNLHLIKGPWFFLSIQELLHYMSPMAAGIIFPIIPLAILALLPWLKNRRNACLIIAVWTTIYAGAIVMALMR